MWTAWMVYDYPEPPPGWMDAEYFIRDEWEEYELEQDEEYEDEDEEYEDEYDEESFP